MGKYRDAPVDTTPFYTLTVRRPVVKFTGRDRQTDTINQRDPKKIITELAKLRLVGRLDDAMLFVQSWEMTNPIYRRGKWNKKQIRVKDFLDGHRND